MSFHCGQCLPCPPFPRAHHCLSLVGLYDGANAHHFRAHWTLAIICNPGKARYGVRVPRQEVRKFRGGQMDYEQSDDVHPCIFFLGSLRISQRVNRYARHLRQYGEAAALVLGVGI